MKKFLPYANYLAAGAGIAAALLHQWTLSVDTDGNGLYPAFHPGWIGYLVVMTATLICLFLMTRACVKNGLWQANFSGGLLPMLGQLVAAIGLTVYGIGQLELCWSLRCISGALALGSAVALIIATVLQHQKQNNFGILYLLPCLFFALQLFLLGKAYRTETQLLRFGPQFFACAASALASYELMGFGAGIGNRKRSLLCSLSAAALCFAASSSSWVYLLLGLWHLLSHCSLTEPAEEETTEEPKEETQEADL
jgi:hypothetical protein